MNGKNFTRRIIGFILLAIIAMGILFSFIGCTNNAKDDENNREYDVNSSGLPLEECRALTGTIIMDNGSKGSGFIINANGYVATCFHVIADTTFDAYKKQGEFILGYGTDTGKSYEIEGVVSSSETYDWAILKIRDSDFDSAIPIGNIESVKIGDNVRVISTPEGREQIANSVVQTSISNVYKNSYGTNEFQMHAAGGITSGSSGGVVIVSPDEDGLYVAIGIHAANWMSAEIAVAIPINYINKNYADEEVKTILEINEERKYFIQSEMTEYKMGERYDTASDEIQKAAYFHWLSGGETWLYDEFQNSYDGGRDQTSLYIRKDVSSEHYIDYYIMDSSSSYKLGRNVVRNEDDAFIPYYYFSCRDTQYMVYVHDDGEIDIRNYGMNNNAEKPEIHLFNYGETVRFRTRKSGTIEGFAADIRGDYIYLYDFKNDKFEGRDIRFDIKATEFMEAHYIDGEIQGDYTLIKSSDIPEIVYTAISANSGKITYASENFEIWWDENGIEMETDSQYAVKYPNGDCIVQIKSENEYNPYIKVQIDGNLVNFSASRTDYIGTIMKNNDFWLLMSNSSNKRIAEINGNEWYIGEGYGNGIPNEKNGKGTLLDTSLWELYVGEFSEDKPEGEGAWIGKEYNILEGQWFDGKLVN